MRNDLTTGNVLSVLLQFSLPYLLSCFLQTFYGLADLFIAGQFNGAETIAAVSAGSQVMHMATVVVAGLSMGGTIATSRALGAKDFGSASRIIGNAVSLFALFAAAATALLLLSSDGIISALSTPNEAVRETKRYLTICFAGIPLITAYNVASSVFRGLGDTKSPMVFVMASGIVNIALDCLFVGTLGMGAAGAAAATVISQAACVALAVCSLFRTKAGIHFSRGDFRLDAKKTSEIMKVGVPIALQDGLIQVSFLVITAIANARGVAVSAAVGISEKIICFLFLVPSAMLSSVSAIAAQNAGAKKDGRGRQTLAYALAISVAFGLSAALFEQFFAEETLSLFTRREPEVIRLGAQYLRAYSLDCALAAAHFCFSGYFCAYNKAMYSFAHNILSILLVRIPGTYLASLLFPDTLYPMGLAAPAGSLLSDIICAALFAHLRRKAENPPCD